MITVNKANPTQGEITSSLTGSTGDGGGLHLANGGKVELANSAAAEFGTSDFSLEFVLNQTGDNASDNYIYFTHGSGNSRLYIYNDISADVLKLNFEDSSGSLTTKILSYDMSADYGTPTHYVLTFDRDANATLYKNGSSVASVDISAVSSIDIGDGNTAAGQFGSSGSYGVLGTFYRFRTWNKLADAKALFERSDVDYADQYGSQTSKILNGTAWTSASGSTPPTSWTAANSATYTIDSSSGSGSEPALKIQRSTDSNPYIYQTFSAVVGKQYRVKYRVKNVDATHVRVGIGSSAVGTQYNATDTTATSWQDFEQTYTATTSTFSVYVQVATSTGTQSGYIDSLVVEQVGCVSDYQTQWANPSQSLTVQDASGAADGTCSASGVTQVQPVVQLNTEQISVGGTNAKIGIGLAAGSNPQEMLHIDGISPRIRLRDSDAAGTPISTIDASGGDILISADANDETTGSDIRLATDGTTHFTIDSSGNVQIGTGSLAAVGGGPTLGLIGAAPEITLRDSATGTPFAVMRTNDHGDLILEADNGNDAGSSNIEFKVDGATAATIASGGLCSFSGGIAFSQTNSSATGATATGTTLDHYEEGTWTPVYSAGASSSGTWDTTLTGEYTRIGNLVTASMKITGTSMDFSSAGGYRTYSGLPFTGTLKGAGAVSTAHAASFSGTTSTNVGTNMTIIPAETGSGTTVVLAQATYRV